MKKLMLNDKFGLTEAVINGTKTMTRRIIPELRYKNIQERCYEWNPMKGTVTVMEVSEDFKTIEVKPQYEIGENVAVAQTYTEIFHSIDNIIEKEDFIKDIMRQYWPTAKTSEIAGWRNKMYVASKLMPYRIIIRCVSIQRMQRITDREALREGIYMEETGLSEEENKYRYTYKGCRYKRRFKTPKEAFADMIDQVYGKGTWEENPWVFAYMFETIKKQS